MGKKRDFRPGGILGLFPQAAESFNLGCEELAKSLEIRPIESLGDPKFMPDRPRLKMEGPITARPLGSSFSRLDGEASVFCRLDAKRMLGLFENGYPLLKELVAKVCKVKTVGDKLSHDFVKDRAFLFVLAVHRAQNPEVTTDLLQTALDVPGLPCDLFTAYLESEASLHVKEYRVFWPIANTFVEHDIELGPITVTTVTGEIVDQWSLQAPEDKRKEFKDFLSPLQGVASSRLSCYSEWERAKQLSLELTERALTFLRFFSAGAVVVTTTTETVLFGREPKNNSFVVVESPEGVCSKVHQGLIFGDPDWVIRADKIAEMREMGLQTIVDWEFAPKITSFQRDLLKSIRLISKAALRREVEDKLLYVLSAVESFFLRDKGENIQNTIGERLAFARRTNQRERKEIVSLVKEVYGHRSDFFHHGQEIENLELIQKFVLEVWKTFASLIQLGSDFETKAELIDDIEVIKFGGTPRNRKLVPKKLKFSFAWGPEEAPKRTDYKFRWGKNPKETGEQSNG